MKSRFLRLCWFVLLVWGVAACQTLPVSPSTPFAIPSATPTTLSISTSDTTITPPEQRRWEAAPVLAYLYTSAGFSPIEYAWSTSADLVIYRDGTVIIELNEWVDDHGEYTILSGQLHREELCSLLVRIESDGFFDSKNSEYVPISITDNGTTTFSVQAWRSNTISAYALYATLYGKLNPYSDFPADGQVPSGLARTMSWLVGYTPPRTERYTPDKVQLLVYPIKNATAVSQWPIAEISLATVITDHATTTDAGFTFAAFEVENEQAAALWAELGTLRRGAFREGQIVYSVTVRPILPFEIRTLSDELRGKDPKFSSTPVEPMDCTMSPLPANVGTDGTFFDPPVEVETTPELALDAVNISVAATFGNEYTSGDPIDVSASPSGDVWVAIDDFDMHRNTVLLRHWDMLKQSSYEILLSAVSCTDYALAAHSDQSVFVANPCSSKITHLNPFGKVIAEWGEFGTGDSEFSYLRDITLSTDEQSLYVVDSENRRITQWTLDGQLLATWSAETLGISLPIGIATDSVRRFYLLDDDKDEVVVYDGVVQTKWPLNVKGVGVYSIAYDESLNLVYVGTTDTDFFVFQPDGVYRGHIRVEGDRKVQVDTGIPGNVYASSGYDLIYQFNITDD